MRKQIPSSAERPLIHKTSGHKWDHTTTKQDYIIKPVAITSVNRPHFFGPLLFFLVSSAFINYFLRILVVNFKWLLKLSQVFPLSLTTTSYYYTTSQWSFVGIFFFFGVVLLCSNGCFCFVVLWHIKDKENYANVSCFFFTFFLRACGLEGGEGRVLGTYLPVLFGWSDWPFLAEWCFCRV